MTPFATPHTAAPSPGFVARLVGQQTLPVQLGLYCGVATAVSSALVWLAVGSGPTSGLQQLARGSAEPPAAAALSALLSGAAVSLVAIIWCTGQRRRLMALAASAAMLARDPGNDQTHLPIVSASPEWRQVSKQLGRLVESARERLRALEASRAVLALRLESSHQKLTSLQDLSIGLAGKSDLHELVDEALGALEQTLDYSSASVWARDDEDPEAGVVLLGYRTGAAVTIPDDLQLQGMRLSRGNLQHYQQIEERQTPLIENRARQSLLSWLWNRITDDASTSRLYRASRSWMALPLRFRDQVMGVMRVDHHAEDYFDAERVRLLTAVGSQAALAMRHSQLLMLEREMAVAEERNRIARDLHDAVSQTLFAANLIAGTLARSVTRDPAPDAAFLAAQAETLERLNRGALAEMRLLMHELRPESLQTAPLAELLEHAIEAITCRGEIRIARTLSRRQIFPPPVQLQIYRIAQEALANLQRHSGASDAQVEWRVDPATGATLLIADNGCGFDPGASPAGHFGLDNMRSRAAEIGALLELHSAPGKGTRLSLELGAHPHGH